METHGDAYLQINGDPHYAAKAVRDAVCLHITQKQIVSALWPLGGSEVEFETECTPAQQDALQRHPDAFEPLVIRLDFPPDIAKGYDRVREAWAALALQHHILRTDFVKKKTGNFLQRILKHPRRVRVCFPEERENSQDGQQPASLIMEWTGDVATAYICLPQAVADRKSLGNLWKDFLSLLTGGVPAPRLPFTKYLGLVNKKTPDEAARFWSETIGSVPALAIHSIPLERHHEFQMTESNTSAAAASALSIRALAKQLGVSDDSVIYAAFGLTLDRYCQSITHEVLFLTEGRDRTIEGHASVVGFADHEYPLKLHVAPDTSVAAAIRETELLNSLSSSYAPAGYDYLKGSLRVAACDFKVVVCEEHEPTEPTGDQFAVNIVVQLGHAVSIVARHDTTIPSGKIKVVLDHFMTALANIIKNPSQPLSEVDIVSPGERALILEMGKPLTEPAYDNVHKLFERQVEQTPDVPAVQFEGERPLSYEQLNRIANSAARQLPVGRGSFVPVCLQRSLNLVISMVAILKTGAAYVTMDPDTPLERNRFIVDDVGAAVVIVDRTTSGRFPREVHIEHIIEKGYLADDTNLDRPCDPADPVYVIYTSGSTGKPKGVLHTHSSATSGLAAFPTLPNLRQLLFHNPVFSAAQRSVWSTLKQGGCLCLASKDNLTIHIGRTINQMQVNVVDVTPSTALLLTPGTVPCLKRMTVAGELINPALIPAWVNELELLNAYGLSENTQVNWRREMVLGQNPQNIGRPSDTTTSFVLVPGTTELSPLLVPGELCLGGHQLAVCYINRPEKTAEAFMRNPYGPGRLYRTGDMVVAHEDGSIEMVGRIDFQVKINGQRVEPGDSNTLIQGHPDVNNSSVVAVNMAGRKSLVAVIVPRTADKDWSQLRSEVKALLERHIPSYMMPTYWLLEKSLPLNVNGKVDIPQLTKYIQGLDREHLLRYSSDHYHSRHYDGEDGSQSGDFPQEEDLEQWPAEAQKLRDILAEALLVPPLRISLDATFQELGGSSLDAIRASAKAYQEDLDLSVADILRLPLRQILRKVGSIASSEKVTEVPRFSLLLADARSKFENTDVEDAFPTTSLQDSFLADSLQGNSTYVYRRYYRLKGVSPAQVRDALEKLSKELPLLRSTFVPNKTSFLQVIRKSVTLSWEEMDISADEYSSRDKQVMESGGNFVFFATLRSQVLAVTMHHALLDYWSGSFLIDDLVTTLRNKPLIPRPSYANFVHHVKQQNHNEPHSFWAKTLEGALPCLLGQETEENTVVHTELAGDIRDFVASNKVSVGSLIYAAWAIVLSLHTSKSDLVFGTTLSGRDTHVPGILRMAGPTITTIPFRIQLNSETSLLDLARTIQEAMWEYAPRAQHGLRNILKAHGHGFSRLFDTIVNVLIKDNRLEPDENDDVLEKCEPHEPNYLDYTMLEAEFNVTGLSLRLLSSLSHTKASLLLGNVAETLRSFLSRPHTLIGDLVPTSPGEEAFLDSLSNQQPTEPGMLAYSLIDRAIARYPQEVALEELSGKKITYREFDIAVDGLAHVLRASGIQTGDIVPICMQKSIDSLVAVFGILKAGAAFTPLDPKNPRDRNDFIVKDVEATIAVTDSVHGDVFESFSGKIINMDYLAAGSREVESRPPSSPGVSPSDLAYVIYTSGSTGLPKGVQVHHAAVAASTEGMIEACKIDDSWHVLWFLNYVFDASYFDVFTVLGSGGTIAIADQDTLIRDLAGCINAFGVKQLMITPTISRLISPADVPTLKALLVCGEPITPEVAGTWAVRMDVYNGYGPTEATILMTVSKVRPDGNLKSIGYPLKAVKASILHPEKLVPVPYGAVGELCVAGGQVAISYLKRPEITSKVFLKAADGSVLYRTGDFARWLPSGEIECLGRRDNQIKLNGFRIELGEIETAILTHAGDLIQSCVAGVVAIRQKKQIVAYYVPKGGPTLGREDGALLCPGAVLDPALILGRLTALAHYTLPKIFLPFWEFPLLPSGKINRKQLSTISEKLAPGTLAKYSGTANAKSPDSPATELTGSEKVLQGAWAELFDVPAESISQVDLFYHHGGDSIAAINLASMLRRLSYSLSVNDIVSNPSLEEQARRLKPVKATSIQSVGHVVKQEIHDKLRAAGLDAQDIEDIYPCAPGQVEFLTQGHTASQFWQLMTVRPLARDFDFNRWVELTRKLTAANQILRAMYLKQDESDPLSWVQVILKDPVLDLTVVGCRDEEEKSRLVSAHWEQRFQLGRPFVRYLVLKHPDGSLDLCTKLDHATYDGTLLRIFDGQFTALRDGLPPPRPTPFRDYVAYTQQGRDAMLAFWRQHLRGAAFLYPAHLTAPRVGASTVARTGLAVNACAHAAGVTASIVFQAAYTLLLARLSRNSSAGGSSVDDVVYDYLLTGRNVDMDEPQLINGTCANFLPFRSRLNRTSGGTVQALLRDTQSGFWQMTDNGSVGLGNIYRALGATERAAKTLFLFQPFEPEADEQDPMRWVVMALSKVTMPVNYAIMFEVFKDVEGHRLKMGYDTRLFSKEEAAGVLELYIQIVRDIVEKRKVRASELLE
ncbi:hypothetical protein B0T25DRAFT_589035 [Lasiosphaeria hispida]|uniref:Carrier domain-containing protein n=1 Tax=Lasiosphaeria hispida TaxID=260671 RepID=A0AAJ0MF67_9PEZI|nr:hypothetical protein B0T25DRAFT_589035 [Lasiosphaeria hispida]